MMKYLHVSPYQKHLWLPSTKSDEVSSRLSLPTTLMASFHKIKDVPGTGKGFVATADVPRGQLIVDESPLLTYAQENPRTSDLEEMERQL